MKYTIRQVDAWADGEDGWTYNQTWTCGEMETEAQDVRRAFTAFLRKHGIVFRKGCTLIDFDGDNYTIVDRKTREPLFDCIVAE